MSAQRAGRFNKVGFWLPAGLAVGGVETWSIEMATRLSPAGWSPFLAVYPARAETRARNVPPRKCPSLVFGDEKWCMLNSRNVRQTREMLPAVLVPNYSLEGFGIAANLSRRHAADLRVLGFCHTDEPGYYSILSRFEPIIHAFVAVSRDCAERLERLIPWRAADIVVRPYAVEVSRTLDRTWTPPGEPIRLLYAGRIEEEQKRVFDLVGLAERLAAADVDFRLRIVGEGSAKVQLEGRLQSLPAQARARVSLEKGVAHQEVPALLRQADLAVMVSAYEGTSLFMLEALAVGCVPVMTRVSGARDVIREGQTGHLVPVGALGEMASVIAALARDRARLEAMGRSAFASAQEYSFDRYLAWFTDLLAALELRPDRTWPSTRPLFPQPAAFLSNVIDWIPGARGVWRRWLRFYNRRRR